MLTSRWLHHLKASIIASIAFFVVGTCAGVAWLNKHGFEGEWGQRIAEELARRGIHAEFESVRYSPTRGVIAKNVIIYADEERDHIFARFPVLRFDVDRGRAFRGELQIRRVILKDAHLSVPVSDDLVVEIRDLTGRASLDRQNRLLLEADRGSLGQMDFRLALELDDFSFAHFSGKPGTRDETTRARRADFAGDLLAELSHWSCHATTRPELFLQVSGSLRRPASIRTAFSLEAEELTRKDYSMLEVAVTGDLDNRTLTFDTLRFSDGSGAMSIEAHYDLQDKTGAYDVKSSIKIADLLRKGLDNHTLDEFSSAHAPRLDAHGEFSHQDGDLLLNAIGTLEWEYFRFLGIPLTKLNTEFSWQNGNIYLRNLEVEHEGETLAGDVLLQDDTVRYRAQTSLPLSAYRAFIKEDSGLERSLELSEFGPESKVLVNAEGSIQRSNLREWVAYGNVRLENFSYNKVPIALAAADFHITPLDSEFTNVETAFDYAAYKPDGPATGTMRAESIRYDALAKLTHLEGLRGTAWPGPILRLFAPRTANHVERHYHFESPPELDASGVVEVRRPATLTDVVTRVKSSGTSNYRFLGQTLDLTGLEGTVRTRPGLNEISDLRFDTLGGQARGALAVHRHPNQTSSVTGTLECEKVDIKSLGQKYGVAKPAAGSLSARFGFEARETRLEDGTRQWSVTGKTNLGKSSYNGTAITKASLDFEVDREGSSWTDIEAELDYSSYPMRKRHGGPSSCVVRVDKIRHDKAAALTYLSNIRGMAWPGPILRLVNTGAADHVDKSYRFRQPPRFSSSGVIDHRQGGARTNVRTEMFSAGTVDYDFLDRVLQLSAVKATVRSRRHRTEVEELAFRAFGGTGAGTVTAITEPGKPVLFSGGIKWDELDLAEIGRKYNFEKAAQGRITGRIDFRTQAGQIRTFNGKGVVGLRNGQLFHVPIFGPLSLPIGGVLGKQFSHEQARDASATFVIKDGVIFTQDFLTSTPSTTFVGEGNIDLVNKRIDMTMRMNARGLLGLVTLPLRPFNGLFQFRGQGPIKKPAWQPAPFTQPAGGQQNPIFRDLPRAEIVPER